jgi:hypothetical protein
VSESSTFSRRLTNLWFGLCRGDPGLPNSIQRLGYRPVWVELSFPNSTFETVCPDLIVSSAAQDHAVLFEWKSGANSDEDQLRRYADIADADLSRRLSISPPPSAHCVVIAGKSEHIARLTLGLRNVGSEFPLLATTDAGLELVANRFHSQAIADVFDPVLEIDWDLVPNQYLPIDGEAEPWEYAEQVLPRIFEYIGERRPGFMVDELCSDICPFTWSRLGPPGQNAIRARTEELLADISRRELNEFVSFDRGRRRATLNNNPYDLPFGQQGAAVRRLQTAHRRLITRMTSAAAGVEQLVLDL